MYLNSVNFTNNKKLSEDELISESLIMLIAGTDTTSVTMTMLMHLYTLYPDVYKKSVEEVRSYFPDRSKLIKFAEAKEKLTYVLATIYECMRLVPIAAGLFFRDSSSEGIELSGFKIPKGTQMGMFIEGGNKDITIWKSPESFIPERFLGPEGEALKKEIVSFSHGVRICIGRNLAWMEIMTVIPNILREFDFKLPSDSLYNPYNLDPSRNGQPRLLDNKVYIVRYPTNPERDCKIEFSLRQD
ncbi:Cytochrome P450 3A24 [Smittium culicis]|uniref:Cytochrome P450 3A24 n=1 Tax=Smittium culicis TaxID=133412 RepID=A0A1R1YJ54_9FUNG|nr:Cytochrome P450 3A24 [Smittium culicis]